MHMRPVTALGSAGSVPHSHCASPSPLPKRWCPGEVGSGPAETPVATRPEEVVSSRGFKTRPTTLIAVPPQLGSVTHEQLRRQATAKPDSKTNMLLNTRVTGSKASPWVQKLLSCFFCVTRQQLSAALQDC